MSIKSYIRILFTILLLLTVFTSSAKDFVDLTRKEMSIDSILPQQTHLFRLPRGYQDSTYTVRLLYPEYTRLTWKEVRRYRKIHGSSEAPATPKIEYTTFSERKNGILSATFTPIVRQGRHLYYISSFKPELTSIPNSKSISKSSKQGIKSSKSDNYINSLAVDIESNTNDATAERYATHSILKEGRWAKISVAQTGIHRLTEAVIRKAGFTDMSRIHIYGYGGNIIPERLTEEWIKSHDDLPEVPSCTINGEKYFYAKGPVSWTTNTTLVRDLNVYSNHGYYFITESDGEAASCTPEQLKEQVVSSTEAHHDLYEVDAYAWAQMGRKLVDGKAIKAGSTQTVNLTVPQGNTSASIKVIVTTNAASTYTTVAGERSFDDNITALASYGLMKYKERTISYNEDQLAACQRDKDGNYIVSVTIKCNSGGPLRIDYISAAFNTPAAPADLSSSAYPAAEYVYNITNQDHHADAPVNLVIIIPTSQKLYNQAKRLGDLHVAEEKSYGKDFTYRIVPADELYNEFSSGTPDVSAYRRYLKMYYDKMEKEEDMPQSVLLFGSCLWDNRLNTLPSYNPDDYLLIYETEESESTTSSTGIDDFITILKDNTTIHPYSSAGSRDTQFELGVGRLCASNVSDATVLVDKIEHYINSKSSGKWTSSMVFIGDDDDSSGNRHMAAINRNADNIRDKQLGFDIKKILLDAYQRESTSQGFRYPDVTNDIIRYQNSGALVINYGGHASPNQLSHEFILSTRDVKNFKGDNYSLWFTAACETMPFDQTAENLGTAAVLNPNGGAIAFIGTLRTVVASANENLDYAFMDHLLTSDYNGEPVTIGEALRQAKNYVVAMSQDLSSNKHQYALFGDPALRLAIPRYKTVVDTVNDIPASDDITLKSNEVATIKGHIESFDGKKLDQYNGTVAAAVKDALESITTRDNDGKSQITYLDRLTTIYNGTSTVKDGDFTLTFRVPTGLIENGNNGIMFLYANNATSSAFSEYNNILFSGEIQVKNEGIGPDIFAYLNTPSFVNGSTVGKTPFFVAEIKDDEGLDVTGNNIGHFMELIVDNDVNMTYDLNPTFTFDEGSYTSGQAYYVLPALKKGEHTLLFRAWDLMGNSSTAKLTYIVNEDLQPAVSDIFVSPNPVKGQATFYVYHDMQGSDAVIALDIIDTSGRLLQTTTWQQPLGIQGGRTELRWNTGGMPQGMYLYRIRVSTNGNDYTTKTKKLIIAQ